MEAYRESVSFESIKAVFDMGPDLYFIRGNKFVRYERKLTASARPLVGRLEGRVRDGGLVIDRLWPEPGRTLDMDALNLALERHAIACGAEWFQRPEIH
ncbi:hypothetical protein [Paraliomyxa miuraensis]|uniref:hypothetical protein n=1 Tax=Paraliomyxa miuraensis TaxID=376150 RepID=UPI00225503D9|nr:hypothetical protein [Paraliomyxa miuraensis]MCX4243966.1 hypothetical protein [Paraliomyxa miuraensis]